MDEVVEVGGRYVGCPACGKPGKRREAEQDTHECQNVKCLVLTFLDPHDTPRKIKEAEL